MDRKNGIGSKIAFALLLIFLYVPIIYVVVFSFNSSKSLTNFTGFSTKWYESCFRREGDWTGHFFRFFRTASARKGCGC